jgi:hypothetical protein
VGLLEHVQSQLVLFGVKKIQIEAK